MNEKRIVWAGFGILSLVLLFLGVSAVASEMNDTSQRVDCPGKVICPLSGEEICKDQCPLGSSTDSSASECKPPACCRDEK